MGRNKKSRPGQGNGKAKGQNKYNGKGLFVSYKRKKFEGEFIIVVTINGVDHWIKPRYQSTMYNLKDVERVAHEYVFDKFYNPLLTGSHDK